MAVDGPKSPGEIANIPGYRRPEPPVDGCKTGIDVLKMPGEMAQISRSWGCTAQFTPPPPRSSGACRCR